MKKYFLFAVLSMSFHLVKSQTMILAKDIAQNLGKTVVICDSVYGTKSFDKISLLNIGATFPNEYFTIVVNKVDESKFPSPPSSMYIGNKICVTGIVSEYKGKMQIVVTEPKQIIVK